MPNIFRFAPKELSQDAMFIWLARCATEGDAALRRLGNAFVQFLLKAGDGTVFDRNDRPVPYSGSPVVSEFIRKPDKYKNMDVYFAAKMDDGTKFSVVIEDKTHTTAHSGQLPRYREIVKNDNIEEDYTKLVYLKTGMPFDDEKTLVGSQGYSFVGIRDLESFLVGEPAASCASDLVQQYRERIVENRQVIDCAERDWHMAYGPIQYRFLTMLQKRIEDSAHTSLSKNRNRGGGAFSKLHFRNPDSLDMFWRIDPGRPLCLRFYRGDDKEANARLVTKHYAPRFQKAVADAGLEHTIGRRWVPKSWEPTIGGIAWPPEANRHREMESFLDAVAQVHRRFLELLRAGSPPQN